MDASGSLALLSLMQSHGASEKLLAILPESTVSHLPTERPKVVENQSISLAVDFAEIHDSWIAKLLESVDEKQKNILISALPESKQEKLWDKNSKKPLAFSNPLVKMMQKKLLQKAFLEKNPGFLPLEILPPHPLFQLISLDKKQIVLLIDTLGLRDLALDVKKVIDKNLLKAIDEALPNHQKEILKYFIKEKERLGFKPIHLENWDKSPQALADMIHIRGLNRLGKALYGIHRGWLWHFYHKLDYGRANRLKKYINFIPHEKAKEILIAQVLEAIQHTHKESL